MLLLKTFIGPPPPGCSIIKEIFLVFVIEAVYQEPYHKCALVILAGEAEIIGDDKASNALK